jgi:hypothetical protein
MSENFGNTLTVSEITWERELLLGRLTAQRHHVLGAVQGLSDEQLRRAVLPSGWTIVGLLRHLTLGLERYWFHTVMGGEPLDYWPDHDDGHGGPADWRVADDEPPARVIEEYRSAIQTSDEVISALHLDSPPRLPEPWWDEAGMRVPDLRSVIVHVVIDTATHAGHLDAVREILDGRQHLVL